MIDGKPTLNPDTLAISKTAFEDACRQLPSAQLTIQKKSNLARRILHHAAGGERDPVRLRNYALAHPDDRADALA